VRPAAAYAPKAIAWPRTTITANARAARPIAVGQPSESVERGGGAAITGTATGATTSVGAPEAGIGTPGSVGPPVAWIGAVASERSRPQETQKRASGLFSVPQFGQITTEPPPPSRRPRWESFPRGRRPPRAPPPSTRPFPRTR